MPDAALVAACDTANGDPATNYALARETAHNRRQRDECAAQVDGVRAWRTGALKRASDAAKAAAAPAKVAPKHKRLF